MAETYDFARTVMQDTVGTTLEYRRISRSSDQSFWGHGIPSVFCTFSEQLNDGSPTSRAQAQLFGSSGRSGGLGWWWHTPADLPDKIDAENLVRDAGIYAETLWRLSTAKRLPFNFARSVEEIADALEHHGHASKGKFDLEGTVSLARALAKDLQALDIEDYDAGEVNALLVKLSRLLVPVNYTQNGPFHQDPALPTSQSARAHRSQASWGTTG